MVELTERQKELGMTEEQVTKLQAHAQHNISIFDKVRVWMQKPR